MTIVNTSTVIFWIITLAVQRSYCAVSPLVLSTNEPEKNGNLVIATTSNDATVDWILNGALPALTSCIFRLLDCTVHSSGNMAFAVNSTSTSLTITSLSYSANNGVYKAESDTGAIATIQITVSSPVTFVSWLNPPASNCPGTIDSVTLTAAIPCVYPIDKIVVVFQIFEQNLPFDNTSVTPFNDGSIGCASHEVNLKATATFDFNKYPNKKIQVSVSVAHSLLKSKPAVISNLTEPICFQDKKDRNSEALYSLFVLLIGVIAFIVLLCIKIKKIEQLDYDLVLNIAQNCCGTWIFSELRFEFLVMLMIKFIEAIIAVPILIVIGKYPDGPVIGIASAQIVGCMAIYMGIFWIVIWCLCRRKIAVNKVDSEIIKESLRKAINGDAGLSSPVTPGRKLPPLPPLTRTDLPPLIQTDPDKLVNTEKKKKKKKKTKTEVNEEDQAETNKSEINDQVDAENLPETNKTSD